MAARRFVELPLDKHDWSPSPLPGQVVLVTTVGADGAVDVAPKSWVTMVAFAGPVVGFGCTVEHRTYRNVLATGAFVINVPSSGLAGRTWRMVEAHGADRLARSGLTLAPARTVTAPVITECGAHLECRLERVVELPGGEVFVLGTVTAVAVAEDVLTADRAGSYAALDPFFFLEDGWYAPAGPARAVADDAAPHP